MKKNLLRAITITTTLTLCLAVVVGCGKSEAPKTQLPAGTVSAEKTSFNAVAAQLDAGGNFYLYLSTEQLLDKLSTKIAGWRSIATALPQMSDTDRANVGKLFDVVTGLIKDSGIEDVSGFGMSSIAVEEKVYHSKTFLHHYPGTGKGFLWNLFGEKPHALEGLDMLPASTAFASFSDVNVSLLWTVIKDQVRRAGIPEAESALNQLPEKFEQSTGLKWEKVIGSLGGEFGVVITLDDSRMITVPVPGTRMEVPEPGIALVVKVKDDLIFDRIQKALEETLSKAGQQLISVNEGGVKMRTVAIPVPLPIQVRPTFATGDGYLFIALSDTTIQEMFAVKSGKKKGLKSTPEFARVSKNVPDKGNNFNFLSQRLGKTIVQLQKQALEMSRNPAQSWLQGFLNPDDAGFVYSVSANTDEGWLSVGNGNQNPAMMMAAVPVVIVGVLAGIAVPNFVRARQTAQSHSCVNNLRQLDGAKAQWALENNKKSTDTPTMTDLQPFLGSRSVSCPQGGRYTIGTVSETPTCSNPGHRL